MIYTVQVAVALTRPPKDDEYRCYDIEAVDSTEALTVAIQMASATCVMVVEAVVVGDTDHPEEP